jgi:pimeloyl-ACP methyl ester carboxylesterase
MADPAVVTRSLSVNGAELAVHDTGGEGPPLVLAGGLGGPFCGWRHQLDYLSDRYRMVGWDYRGLFGSTVPEHESPSYSVSEHADDFENVLSACGIARAPFIGWSMGVQVVLELYERHPEMVSHLVLINGTWGRPLETLPIPVLRQLLPRLLARASRLSQTGGRLLRRATEWPETVLWLKRLGIVGSTLDEELFREVATEFGNVNLEVYLKTLRALGEHDASHVLESIEVPALVITGDRDPFTPRQLAQRMARRIPGGEILVVRGGTHYTPIEYPELVNLRIEKFLREHGY